MAMTPAVTEAIDELKASFAEASVSITEDGSGGAFVRLAVVDPGPAFQQRETWVGCHLGFQYPHADVYPHYVRPDLIRIDGRPLVPPLHAGHPSHWGPAVMISRRSNRHDPATATAATKLISVLEWMSTQ
jgi:hypothetical protein